MNLQSATAASSTHHILLVEDDRHIASMLVDLFMDSGFQAVAAATAVEMERLMRSRSSSPLPDRAGPGNRSFKERGPFWPPRVRATRRGVPVCC